MPTSKRFSFTVLLLAIPVLAGGGVMLALKGVKAKTEQEVSHLLSDENRNSAIYDVDRLSISLHAYILPHHGAERTIVAVRHEIA